MDFYVTTIKQEDTMEIEYENDFVDNSNLTLTNEIKIEKNIASNQLIDINNEHIKIEPIIQNSKSENYDADKKDNSFFEKKIKKEDNIVQLTEEVDLDIKTEGEEIYENVETNCTFDFVDVNAGDRTQDDMQYLSNRGHSIKEETQTSLENETKEQLKPSTTPGSEISSLSEKMSSKRKKNAEYKCTICNKKFKCTFDLTAHVRIHTGEKPYECTICNKKCRVYGGLTVHMRTHTGEKPQECNICEKKFYGDLRRHIRKHHKDVHDTELDDKDAKRKHECNICNKKFLRPDHLAAHMRGHTGEKPYKCEICHKNFVQSGLLNRHMEIHTRDKFYECSICDKKFIASRSVARHMRIHTREKPLRSNI